MKVLVVGNGGREHAMAWKLADSPLVDKVYCAKGNGGTFNEKKCENVDLNAIDEYLCFAKENRIDFTVVGPEVPLVEGIVDIFKKEGLKIFGPSKEASKLEGSKAYAKEFMKKYKVKTADYEVFDNAKEAINYLKFAEYPMVIKADGLAAGKGVVICSNSKEAESCIKEFMVKDVFKGSGKTIVIEEYLEGVEASILAITDGQTIIPFISAKDHKNIFDGNKGPNTGGMGAIAPNPYFNGEVRNLFEKDILKPTLTGIQEENLDYIGIIFFGVMITNKGVYLLEYNVRMGDPETQAVLPLFDSDFAEIIISALNKNLKDCNIKWKNQFSCCVIASSKGYPGVYETGFNINGLEKVSEKGKVFIAGGEFNKNTLRTSGGRVLGVTAVADSMDEARKKVYNELEKINFEGMYYRSDI